MVVTIKKALRRFYSNQPPKSGDEMELVLHELGGTFGRFQIFNYIMVTIPYIVAGFMMYAYVFTTLNVDYRCAIPECDNMTSPEYDAAWLKNAMPMDGLESSKCHRYAPTNGVVGNNRCDAAAFNRSHIITCTKDELIYRNDEISIYNAFGLVCQSDAQFKLSLIGTTNNAARLVAMPLMGSFSDRQGRHRMLLFGTILAGVSGFLQSFSINYIMFISLELIGAIGLTALTQTMIILSLEWANTSTRNAIFQLLNIPHSLAILSIGLIAAYCRDYRLFLRSIHTMTLVSIVFIYFIPESFRWLLASRKRDRVEKMIARITRMNNCRLSPRSQEIIHAKLDGADNAGVESAQPASDDQPTIKAIFASRVLLSRFVVCMLCWLVSSYVNQGNTIMSVFLRGDKYTNYVLVSASGLPACIISIALLRYMGRCKSMAMSFLIVSITTAMANLMPDEYYLYSLILFLVSRCFVLTAYLILYVQAVELWPTPLRQTMVGLSTMAGRIGTMVAPMTPLLSELSPTLPFWTFAVASLVAGALVMFLPETSEKGLPDTIEQAIDLGRKEQK